MVLRNEASRTFGDFLKFESQNSTLEIEIPAYSRKLWGLVPSKVVSRTQSGQLCSFIVDFAANMRS